jgi:hypothetical protein
MNMIYNSPNYCVVEFKSDDGGDAVRADEARASVGRPGFAGGFEIMDKLGRREMFLDGALAERFRDNVQQLIETEPTTEEVDDFLSQFDGLMQQPLVLH